MVKRNTKQKLLPKETKQVFQGKLFNAYQWKQLMFDGGIKTFEKIERPDTVVTIPVFDSKVIINKEIQPGGISRIDFPRGKADPEDQDIQSAALRELRAETGITPKKLYYIGSEQPNSKILWFIHFFIADEIKKKSEKDLDTGELIKNMEFSLDEFYKKVKSVEIDLPNVLLKSLINDTKKDFLDRFRHPDKYFEEIV